MTTGMRPKLRFDIDEVKTWASRYDYGGARGKRREEKVCDRVPTVKERGYLTLNDLQIVTRWKSSRSAQLVSRNSGSFVSEITRFSLDTECDQAAIESLTLIAGVRAATASVILHFFHRLPYPIIDFRALWSVSLISNQDYRYTYELWSKYTAFCRSESCNAGVSMRMLDRALWQYSKSNQP